MTEKKILIVGYGFIGRNFANWVARKGYDVSILTLNRKSDAECPYNQIVSDITDFQSVKTSLEYQEFEYVVNCAGYINHSLMSGNGNLIIKQHLDGTMNLVSSIRSDKLEKYIHIGSSDEYGKSTAPQSENLRESPVTPYSFAKTASTHFLQMLYESEAVPVTILRLFLVYGPGQKPDRLLPLVIQNCLDDKLFPVSEGMQVRDYCFINDICEGIYRAMLKPDSTGQVINLASGTPVRIRDVIDKVVNIIGKGKPDYGAIPCRKGESMNLYASIERAVKMLDWAPVTTLDEGLRKTIDSYI